MMTMLVQERRSSGGSAASYFTQTPFRQASVTGQSESAAHWAALPAVHTPFRHI